MVFSDDFLCTLSEDQDKKLLNSPKLSCGFNKMTRELVNLVNRYIGTVEPRYNEDLGTMKITLLFRFLIIAG